MAAGRPRQFDIDEATEKAMNVFWRRGYEGASIPELTKAMGISAPSLYAAFGSKEALFRKVLDRYDRGPSNYNLKALQALTAHAVAEQLLLGAVNLLGDERNPRGCLVVQGALACADAEDSVRQELILRRAAGEEAIRNRLKRAKAEGDLPSDSDPAALAHYIRAVIYGLSVQAAGGASRRDLTEKSLSWLCGRGRIP